MFTSVEKKTHLRHVVEAENESDAGTEMYSLDDLPRITALNNEEVQSIDSALLSAEEQDLMDSSSGDIDLSGHRAKYVKNHGGMLIATDDIAGRRLSNVRRISAVSAARKMSTATHPMRLDEHSLRSDRRISVVNSNNYEAHNTTPSTLRRNVSAFGEITVMPVGDNEDEDLMVTVEEEVHR